ncbi:hypothetical protein K435DRAFT_864204 [Dendrothele bispora CBS 962.96]|uniref:Uncharacterized protein n=1 Tax=Dendrothele bispora (strain CBS 962.96) TaxID=1314807 RepID=A0A4S8LN72_DENBC|nr:hypothetical protein K435DRAFT_864204 [Dendrothele bispora CBS 962.96]
MLAISCAVIYAILQDHAYSKCEKFPPPNLDVVWNYYMEKLKKLGEKTLLYHKIMHGLYTTVSHR